MISHQYNQQGGVAEVVKGEEFQGITAGMGKGEFSGTAGMGKV